eukprot:scaffold24022_cov28-Tisochrysis_lutea.AAC.4
MARVFIGWHVSNRATIAPLTVAWPHSWLLARGACVPHQSSASAHEVSFHPSAFDRSPDVACTPLVDETFVAGAMT